MIFFEILLELAFFWESSRQPKICNFDIAFFINENIGWLDIPVDNSCLMDIAQGPEAVV